MRDLADMRGARLRRRRGFTLAEVAVTIVIVGIGLVLVLQGLNTAKISAAQTRSMKLARELALYTLGQVESGLYQEDIESGLAGSYADQGYADFVYEVAVGDKSFREKNQDGTFDSFAPRDTDKKKKDEETVEEPFEKVKIRVTYPKINAYNNELILERWMVWKQVYGETEDADKKGTKKSTTSGAGNSGTASNSGSSSATTPSSTGSTKK